ncbi:9-O-acetylesterase [Parabacteroides sp. OttesenSCG-928-N08]|nr:9-O-acetylesterase [Parabacteroides sp. OttesenSCG-928-N08]
MRNTILACIMLFQCMALAAQVKLSPLFTDHMVMQQQAEVPIWGETKANKRVTITPSWDQQTYQTTADAQGKWKTTLKTPTAGGPYTITISDGKKLTLNDVLIGEVWLCSGQSNMEMQIQGWGMIYDWEKETREAANYPNIRFLTVEKATSNMPLDHFNASNGGWMVCSPETAANFSAVGYFFGRDLHTNLDIPIGLINSSWGGTIAEAWTSGETLKQMPDFKEAVDYIETLPNDREEVMKQHQEALAAWRIRLDEKDPGYEGGKALWASPAFDDSAWEKGDIPNFYKNIPALKRFSGIAWFRYTIDIPAAWEGKELILSLGGIDDNDFTFFNGVVVGETNGWDRNRVYKIPGKLVKRGKAVIAVRCIDTGGDGGMHGSADKLFLEGPKGDKLSLVGKWSFHEGMSVVEMPQAPADPLSNPNVATVLYNGMIHPLLPFTIKGAIWYQGESNADRAYQYRELMPLMIKDWRLKWGYEFPFYLVQLANFMVQEEGPEESAWAELREAQLMTLNLTNTGMAVTIDIGDAADIHPKNKQDVGKRLALAARANTYGEEVAYSGPLYDSYRMEGDKIRLFFRHTNGGLKAKEGELKSFTIAGLDHQFYKAQAVIDGNTIVVSAAEVPFPIAVRYGWANNPECNLYNGAGLPASPFRTDDWQGVTYRK